MTMTHSDLFKSPSGIWNVLLVSCFVYTFCPEGQNGRKSAVLPFATWVLFGSRASSSLRMKDQMKFICKKFLGIGVIFRDKSNDGN